MTAAIVLKVTRSYRVSYPTATGEDEKVAMKPRLALKTGKVSADTGE